MGNWIKSCPIMINIDIKHFISLFTFLLPLISSILPSLTISCWHLPDLCLQPISLSWTSASYRQVTTSTQVVSVWTQYHPLHKGQPSPSHLVAWARAHMSPRSLITKPWGCYLPIFAQVHFSPASLPLLSLLSLSLVSLRKQHWNSFPTFKLVLYSLRRIQPLL